MIEFVLRHDGARWHAMSSDCRVDGRDLGTLEQRIAEIIRKKFGERCPQAVAIRFDNSTMPQWLRQYQSHYFNYFLRIAPETHT